MSLSTTFMNFTTGVLEADKKNTKENLLIRGKELDAKRNAVLEMKKSKYNDEIETYKKDKVKIDGLNAVQADWDKGKYKITKDGKTGTDTKALGYDFLVAKHGIEWVQKQKTHLLGAESDPTAWNAYLNSTGRNLNIKGDKLFTDFKERSVIDSNYLESEINKSLKARFELVKKDISKKNSNNDIAYYTDTEIASDYVYDQSDANLNLLPVFETILFSGIPEPKLRPIPNKPEHFKSVTLSLKNKKMLTKNLETYLGKNYQHVFNGLVDYVNFKIEENLTFLMDENDYVVEIQTFAKNSQNLNLRRNSNKKFVF